MRTVPAFPVIVAIALCAAGCTTVGPDYHRPAMPMSDDWVEAKAGGAVDPQWWAGFGDPVLVRLMSAAIAGNRDLQEATARLLEARASRDATLGKRRPEGNLTGSATRNRLSENAEIPVGRIPGFDPTFPLYDAGFDARWEIDFWGRRMREAEAARARVEAAADMRSDVIVQITGELARDYVDLRGAQAEIAALTTRQAAEAALVALLEDRFRHGESGRIEVEDATARARGSAGLVSGLRARAAGLTYSIALLAGLRPDEIPPELRTPAPIPDAPAAIALGLRSELLRRRPDIRRAERELAASTADIGVAKADLFPRISLVGSIAQQSRSVGDLLGIGATTSRVGPFFSWPIFSLGRIRSQVRGAEARADVATALYEQAVLKALNDTERAANAFAEARVQADEAERALAAQQASFRLSSQRFAAAEDDRLAVERARLLLAEAQQRLGQAQAAAAREATALYKEVGGAWQASDVAAGLARKPARDGTGPDPGSHGAMVALAPRGR